MVKNFYALEFFRVFFHISPMIIPILFTPKYPPWALDIGFIKGREAIYNLQTANDRNIVFLNCHTAFLTIIVCVSFFVKQIKSDKASSCYVEKW